MDIHGDTFYLFFPSAFFHLIYLPFYLGLAILIVLDGTSDFYFNINSFHY